MVIQNLLKRNEHKMVHLAIFSPNSEYFGILKQIRIRFILSRKKFESFLRFRYRAALKTNTKFKDMNTELANGMFDLLHRLFLTEDARRSWYELSCFNRFEECEGDDLLSWKDKGYVTVLDLLQVI